MEQRNQEFPKVEKVDESTKGWAEVASEAGLKINVRALVAKLEKQRGDSLMMVELRKIIKERMTL